MKKKLMFLMAMVFAITVFTAVSPSDTQPANRMKLALLKYNGGGDWYSNPTALRNLARFCNRNLGTYFDETDYEVVEVGSAELYNHPFVHMTGHGNVVFSDAEAENLRNYLIGGGFLHIDDNYGMDPFVRTAMKKVFPELDLIELPFEHPIYHQRFDFDGGLPKVHEHDGQGARGYGWIYEGRLLCFYSFESDLGDGWEDPAVHKDPEAIRQLALRMGANIIQFAFEQ